METGEAIMGVTKTLMASNDTLFNFEDTLGDRDDMFSPRTPSSQPDLNNYAGLSSRSTSAASSQYECRTPTALGQSTEAENELQQANSPITNAEIISAKIRNLKPMDFDGVPSLSNDDCCLPDWADNASQITAANDLLSPDQQKTFSEDICTTVDHVSSDQSGTFDVTFTSTNTLEEKTCISIPGSMLIQSPEDSAIVEVVTLDCKESPTTVIIQNDFFEEPGLIRDCNEENFVSN